MKPVDVINEHFDELKKQYSVSKIGLFGSFARGEGQSESDVDILVDFSAPVDLFTFIALKEYLEILLDREVDLVTRNALKPLIRDSILSEVTYL